MGFKGAPSSAKIFSMRNGYIWGPRRSYFFVKPRIALNFTKVALLFSNCWEMIRICMDFDNLHEMIIATGRVEETNIHEDAQKGASATHSLWALTGRRRPQISAFLNSLLLWWCCHCTYIFLAHCSLYLQKIFEPYKIDSSLADAAVASSCLLFCSMKNSYVPIKSLWMVFVYSS